MRFRDSSIEGITFRRLYMVNRPGGAYSPMLEDASVYAGPPGRPGKLVMWIFHRPICCLGGEIRIIPQVKIRLQAPAAGHLKGYLVA